MAEGGLLVEGAGVPLVEATAVVTAAVLCMPAAQLVLVLVPECGTRKPFK